MCAHVSTYVHTPTHISTHFIFKPCMCDIKPSHVGTYCRYICRYLQIYACIDICVYTHLVIAGVYAYTCSTRIAV